MYSQKITNSDFETFDYIIGMNQDNVDDLKRMNAKHQNKAYLYLDINDFIKDKSIPDPYYSGYFNETYQCILSGITLWIEKFKSELQN